MSLRQKVDLTGKQSRQWDETRTKLLYDAPMFSHIFYTMLSRDDRHAYFTNELPEGATAATDDSTLFIKPSMFFDRPIGNRVFITAHEVCHSMFNHAGMGRSLSLKGEVGYADGTKVKWHEQSFQKACDIFVNSLLIESNVGEPPPDTFLDKRFTSKDAVLDVYRTLVEELGEGGGGDGGQGDGQGDNGFDQVLPPGTGEDKPPQQAMQDRNEDEWRMQIEAAMASAKARGQLPLAMQRALETFMEPKVEWTHHITALFARRIGTSQYDWAKPDRRMISRPVDPIFAPGRRGTGCDLVVVAADSSGSIGDKTAANFFGEMSGILADLNPKEIQFVWCDAETHGWEAIEDADDLARVQKVGILGGGGTAFTPVFDDIRRMGLVPDAVVYLTDGDAYGPKGFPDVAPPYPVIWGDISGEPEKYPWGDVVQVPVQAE